MLFSGMDFRKDESAGYLANHMARLFAIALNERIGPLGLAPAQFMTLLELWNEDGLSQKDLVQRLDVEQATMANTLSRMERDVLVLFDAYHAFDALPHDADALRMASRCKELRDRLHQVDLTRLYVVGPAGG